LRRQARLDAGLCQVDLAVRRHKPRFSVSTYESGERRLLPEVRQVALAVGLSLEEVVRRCAHAVAPRAAPPAG